MKHFKSIFRTIATVILLNLTACNIYAQDSIRISLLTCSPGQEVYAQYGHTAIRIEDPARGLDIAVNYGMFSSRQPYFIPRFIFGLTDYSVADIDFYQFCEEYSYYGRGVVQQELNISAEDKKRIIEALTTNLRPENRVYRYNFFFDNCTSRARDIITDHLTGKLKYADNLPVKVSFRDMIHQWNKDYPWSQFGEDLLLGIECDRATTRSEQQFLPENLKNDFAKATYNGQLFVKETTNIISPVQQEDDGFPIGPFATSLILLLVSGTIMTWEYKKKKILWGWDLTLMLLSSLPGIILTLMMFSQHPCVRVNLLYFFMNPLPLFFIYRSVKRTRRNEKDVWWKIWFGLIFAGFIGGFFQTYPTPMLIVALSLLTRPLIHLYGEHQLAQANPENNKK